MLYIHVCIYMHMYIHVTKIKEVVMNWGPLEELEGTKEGEGMTWMKFSKILCHTHTHKGRKSPQAHPSMALLLPNCAR